MELTPKELEVVIPVANQLSLKDVATAFGVKSNDGHKDEASKKITGHLLGGISPLGKKD